MSVNESSTANVSIIGGGLAGILIATQLLRDTQQPLLIRLFAPEADLGRGVAYATANIHHRLNGPAKNFSLHPSEPLHFADWYSRRQALLGLEPEDESQQQFAPRWIFGDYIREQFSQALANAAPGVIFEHIASRVADLQPLHQGWCLHDENGRRFYSDLVQLALGVFPASPNVQTDTTALNLNQYLQGPWDDQALKYLASSDDVVIIGSGLTMLDAIVALESEGFRGNYHVVSRRNLVPEARREVPAWSDFLSSYQGPLTARALLARVRAEARKVQAAGEDWQRLVLAVRPHLHPLWRKASVAERRRFARHVRVYWDVFLHRMPIPSASVLGRVTQAHRLQFISGRVSGVSSIDAQQVSVQIKGRQDEHELITGGVINCTGFEYDWRRISDPLVRNLLQRGLVQPSSLGVGIAACVKTQQVIGCDQKANPQLYTSGVSLRGELFEAGTIGELLRQAVLLSEQLRQHFSSAAAPVAASA